MSDSSKISEISLDSPFGEIAVYVTKIDTDVSPNRREREVEAVQRILNHIFGPNTIVEHKATGQPYLKNRHDLDISISHSHTYAAVGVGAAGCRVGIDIESWRDQLQRVAPRILSKDEMATYACDKTGLLEAWTLKEALYKSAGIHGADFTAQLHLPLHRPAEHKKASASRYLKIATDSEDCQYDILYSREVENSDVWLSVITAAI